MANNWENSNQVLQAICPTNALKLDDMNQPSVMVFIPAFRLCDVLSTSDTSIHPAFRRNGVQKDGFWFGKFESKMYNGRAYSRPNEDPTVSMNQDQFVAQTKSKGEGWHEATNAEWAAIALWCHKNGCEPYGNNNYGKDARETTYKARKTSDDSGKTGRVATGTGPVTWSHDGTLAGIWDMNGNVWEWVTGLRLIYGEIQIIADNDAADNSCDLSASSTAWKAIRASDGALVTPDGNGTTDGTVKMDWISNKCVYSTTITTKADTGRGCSFKDVTCDSTIGAAAKLLLQALAMLPDTALTGEGIDANYGGDYFYFNNGTAERCPYRGAYWHGGGYAGVFYVYLSSPRSNSSAHLGGRSAYQE